MKIQVLDHGYVEFIEAWGIGREENDHANHGGGCEIGIIEAARQSTQGSFRGWEEDIKLLRFLHKNKHETPFEFAGMVIEVQAPIFVFREWHRHRTQSYNEMSARYAPLPDLYYQPTAHRCTQGIDRNKQAAGITGKEVSDADAQAWVFEVMGLYARAEKIYQRGLTMGIPKEVARVVMPVGHYTRMRASANLRNWLAFLTLRMDPKAQWEIRQFANAVGQLIAQTFPQTWQLVLESKSDE